MLIVLFVFKFVIPSPTKIEKEVTLSEIPKYGHYKTKGKNSRTVYYVELAFLETTTLYKISSLHYNYFRHLDFKNKVKIGEKLKIICSDDEIIEIYQNDFNYIDYEACEHYHNNELKLVTYIFLIGFFISILILISKQFIRTRYYLILLKYAGIIIISFLIISWLLLAKLLNFEVIDSDWMKYPIDLDK